MKMLTNLPIVLLRPKQRLRTLVGNSSLVYRYTVANAEVTPNFPGIINILQS